MLPEDPWYIYGLIGLLLKDVAYLSGFGFLDQANYFIIMLIRGSEKDPNLL